MGLFDFIASAGEKIFGGGVSDAERSAKLQNFVLKMGLDVKNLKVEVAKDIATVRGQVPSQEVREKVILAVGNTEGVAKVDDRLEVVRPAAAAKEPEAKYYTVQKGDTLSKIAKSFYGDAMKYPVIFEANKPMLTNPDKIYPGQVLRIPPQ